MTFSVLPLVLVSLISYEGHGILNQIDVGKHHQLDEISEVKCFRVTHVAVPDVGEDDAFLLLSHFELVVDGEVAIGGVGEHKPSAVDGNDLLEFLPIGIPPNVKLSIDGKPAALFSVISEKVMRDGGECWSFSWSSSVTLTSTGSFFFQMYPNTDRLVSVSVPFTAAEAVLLSRGKDGTNRREVMTFDELQKRLIKR